MLVIDSTSIIVFANPAVERIFGYKPAELIGQPLAMIQAEHQREAHEKGFQRYLSSGSTSMVKRAIEAQGLDRAGNTFPVEFSFSHLRCSDGDWFAGFFRDISDRKRYEQSKQAEAEMRHAKELAESATEMKSNFLANMSHELRSPLNAVIGMAGLARKLSTDPKQREYLDKTVISGKYLSRIINDLLDLSKIAAGRMEFETVAFSLSALLQHCNSIMANRAAEKGLKLVESIDSAVPDVLLGDPVRIEQILINLIANGIKFTATGGVAVRVGLKQRAEHRICLDIEVEDTGVGMRPEDLERLFKPFSQGDATVSRQFGGTGLGLAISKRLAELMDGDISVTSRAGRGSIFRTTLWLGVGDASELLPTAEAEQESVQVRYQDVRVLIVDDQPFNRDVAEGLLAAVGIAPQQATNGQEALDLVSTSPTAFDLVLMDIQMPVMDGLTATRAIRRLNGMAQLPIIAMTGQAMEHEKARSIAAGMSGHLVKPFDEASFYRVLSKSVPKSKQRTHATAGKGSASANGFPSLRGVDTRSGLALLQGDETRYRHWLRDFVAEAPATLRQIRQALADGLAEPASMAVHTLKGRVGLLGMNELHAIAAALEVAIGSAQSSAELLLNLESGVAVMCVEIQGGLGAIESAEPAVAALPDKLLPGAPPASIRLLLERLQAGDGDCDMTMRTCLGELKDTDWAPHLCQAQIHIRNFDFATASLMLSANERVPAQEGMVKTATAISFQGADQGVRV